jgi:hypothetical protein
MSTPFTIESFRGGLNTFDPPTSLAKDQVVEAINVELVDATCGGRRLGHSAITLPATVTGRDGVYKMHRHLPTTDESAAQLWLLSATVSLVLGLSYKNDAVWTDVALTDTPDTAIASILGFQMVSLHGKLYCAYKSASDRLHVYDGSSFRRVGLATPAAPSVGNSGAGALNGKRFYRVRYTVMSGSTVLRRSEASPVTSFTPTQNVRITKPASIGEGETHWEVEASTNNADFYRITQVVVGTTTYDDTTVFNTGYNTASNTLSEDAGDYTVFPSGKFLVVDNDRLLVIGSWTLAAEASRVRWSPPTLDPGVGSDERMKLETDPFLDLDTYQGGEVTGAVAANGVIYVFKWGHIYRLVRSGSGNKAYEAVNITTTLGAIPGSVVVGEDPSGNPAVYFIDRNVGPCMIGIGGQMRVGLDIKKIWDTRSTAASVNVLTRGVYFSDKRQVRWAFTESGQSVTSKGLWLHTDRMEVSREGGRRGWTTATGPSVSGIWDMILYSDNVESGAARSSRLVPLVSRSDATAQHHVLIGESGTTDDGTQYAASIRSRPFIFGGGVNKFGVRGAAIIADAAANVTIDMMLRRDFGKETTPSVTASLSPTGAESLVIAQIDNIVMSEARALDIRIADSGPATGTWKVQQLTLIPRQEQQS